MTSLIDLAQQQILLDQTPDLKVARVIVRRLIAAIHARDAVIQSLRRTANTDLLEETT